MKLIPLNQGLFAQVDDQDYDQLMAMGPWWVKEGRNTNYAVRGRNDFMHHRVIGKVPDKVVDHEDDNGLNNRRVNLSHIPNAFNVFKSSRYKGVYLCRIKRKWYARSRFGGKTHQRGYFDTQAEAEQAYASLRKAGFEYFCDK